MNPETKLTIDQLLVICNRHSIIYKSHERITSGFNHEVHRLNDDLVIKLFNKETNKNFLCESRILQVDNAAIIKPKIKVAYQGNDEERSYIIMSYVAGVSPGNIWHKGTNQQRDNLISQISKVLTAFQSIDTSLFDFQNQLTWQEYLDNKSKKLIKQLLEKQIINNQKAKDVKAIINKLSGYFSENEPMKPVYWDVHFDNFIVDNKFQLKAIIDLENVRLLPVDYPLFVVKKQMNSPEKYLSEADEKFANKADYVLLWGMYKKHYPGMFDFKDLDKRVKLYQFLDDLHLMIRWSHVAELVSSFNDLFTELKTI